MMNFKKLLAMLLAVMMLLSFAACGETKDEGKDNTTTEPQKTEPQETEPQETDPQLAQVSFFTISLTDEEGNTKSIYVMDNEDGTAHIDYVGQIVKRGELDASVLTTVTDAFAASGLAELNGKNEGDPTVSVACGSLYASLSDESMITADFYGEIPEDFVNGYAAMETCLDTLTAEMPEYVPAPMEMGEIAESDRTALNAILSNMTLGAAAESYAISGVAKDEFFGVTLGLSSDEGVASGLNFASTMMSVAYSLNIVTLEDGADVNAVAADFESNIDWLKWVCVQPSDVLIATQGNQVLCLLAADEAYTMTADAIAAAGWTTYTTVHNPNL